MDHSFAQQLCDLNTRFYQDNSTSFSATRHASWEGWHQVAQALRDNLAAEDRCDRIDRAHRIHQGDHRLQAELPILRVTDVACGNLRFERFLAQEFEDMKLCVQALDNCDDLLPLKEEQLSMGSVTFHHCDIMAALQDQTLHEALTFVSCSSDLAVSFGFMHHIPLVHWREKCIRGLVHTVRPGALVAVSFWRFADDEDLAAKASRTHQRALDALGWNDQREQFLPGDYLVGWQNRSDSYRYCHSFSDHEISLLAQAVSDISEVVTRFRADGRTHALNEYLILRRLPC